MITTILASLAMFPAQAATWTPSPETPEAVAKRVDDCLATLSKATLLYQYTYHRPNEHPEGGTAQAACLGNIAAPGVFWLQVPHMDFHRRDPINYEIWIADGKRFSGVVDPADPAPVPIAKRPLGPAHPATVWFTDFSKVILSGLGRPTHPFQSLIADARKQGYKVVAQTRTFEYQKIKRHHYRLVAYKGTIRYEIVIDATGREKGTIPVSVTNTIGTDSRSSWAAVRWNFKPGKTLNVAAINFRKKAPTTLLAPTPRRS